MMRPDTGSRWNVSGSSIATVATGPMPGSTPTSVPTKQPTSAKPRFAGVRATAKPSPRLERKSISPLWPHRDRQADAPDEDRQRQNDERDRGRGHLQRPALA